ncbi:DUF2231 domain-containing protein [Gottfriedia sp. S16(2024)]|uniref:DUF2231 domain-containing protein n=1 Tax=Gottfriedia sp. S16(2024) TaxID=3162883 RepID=UPI003D2324DF
MINEVTSHLHPILVHFPIAFITLAVLKDFWSAFFKKVNFQADHGMWLWIFAALSFLFPLGQKRWLKGILLSCIYTIN